MRKYEDCRQILYTFTGIFKACRVIGEIIRVNKFMLIYFVKSLMEENVMIGNALVDMYAKCDDLEKAQLVVDELSIQDLVSWN